MTFRLGTLLSSGRLVFETEDEQSAHFAALGVVRVPVTGLIERAVSYGVDDDGRRTVTLLDRVAPVAGFGWNFADYLCV